MAKTSEGPMTRIETAVPASESSSERDAAQTAEATHAAATRPSVSVEAKAPSEEPEVAAPAAEQPAAAHSATARSATEHPATAQPTAAPAANASQGEPGALTRLQRWFSATFPHSTHAVLGGLVGLILALLFFSIGIIKTLVIVVLVVAGVTVGQFADGDPKLAKLFQNLMKRQ